MSKHSCSLPTDSRISSCEAAKHENLFATLPWVPKIIFPDGFGELEALTRSIMESQEFEEAMNIAATEFGKIFDAEEMPEEIVVLATEALDQRHLFGLVDQSLDPDEEANYIHLSKELLDNIRKQPGPNYELKFMACVVAVHEVAHFLLGTALQISSTPLYKSK
jgi:hypothetical protein